MNATRTYPIALLILAVTWLTACDNQLTDLRRVPAASVSEDEPTTPTPRRSRDTRPEDDVTMSLSDGAGSFGTHVPAQQSGSYGIDMVPLNPGGEALLPDLWAAAQRWTAILRGTELDDIIIPMGPKPLCGGLNIDHLAGTVDDLAILVSVQTIDGPGGTVATGGPCWVRWEGTQLPFMAVLFLDRADIGDLDAETLNDVLVHEIGHVLGFGTLWDKFDLLHSPSLRAPGADTHFHGAIAIAAFDAAGGRDYADGKVPVENHMGYGSSDIHWRESILDAELMTPVLRRGEDSPLSAITIQSLADLGYRVDAGLAEAFTLPAADRAAISNGVERDRTLTLAGDVLMGPLLAFDNEGNLVKELRN